MRNYISALAMGLVLASPASGDDNLEASLARVAKARERLYASLAHVVEHQARTPPASPAPTVVVNNYVNSSPDGGADHDHQYHQRGRERIEYRSDRHDSPAPAPPVFRPTPAPNEPFMYPANVRGITMPGINAPAGDRFTYAVIETSEGTILLDGLTATPEVTRLFTGELEPARLDLKIVERQPGYRVPLQGLVPGFVAPNYVLRLRPEARRALRQLPDEDGKKRYIIQHPSVDVVRDIDVMLADDF